jgi:16S rRNA (guanine966-N2)-methyltransferase
VRVIGGEFRSRLLKSLPGLDVRPTPDRLRETLFNVLAANIGGVVFADLYAGTGAVGIEALSRGASKAVFIEQNRAAVRVIRENLASLGLDARADVRQGHVLSLISIVHADIVFLDPPYRLEKEYQSTLEALGKRRWELVIAQHDVRATLSETYGEVTRKRVLKQGDNCLSFYGP